MSKHHVRNVHGWSTRDSDGLKRELRARLFGKRWTIEEKSREDGEWTPIGDPSVDDLLDLQRVLMNKYQRKHLAWDHVAGVEKMIRDRGGSLED